MLERLKQWLASAESSRPSNGGGSAAASEHHTATPGKDACLVIDVRSDREYRLGALQGAVNLPLATLEQRIRDVATDLHTPLALYCASGARSNAACGILRQMGYANVRNAGGLYAAAATLQRELQG